MGGPAPQILVDCELYLFIDVGSFVRVGNVFISEDLSLHYDSFILKLGVGIRLGGIGSTRRTFVIIYTIVM